ncbi:helix-turn-helix transcriptional regulator [Tunicatimonas pelagia]|uniref:helix-turn-helix transcriptional regulator n=1 Tax=Tunicatimonas pelagia TaxID=931531 RepID=UPI002665ADF4|nr:AraC family transcriptional regulator [Tunicatimonas pelagia]WKN44846.1 AraC family transcriptional regulator [Tunicatimonas pelagia]
MNPRNSSPLYRTVPANQHGQLLFELAHRRRRSEDVPGTCYLIYLDHNPEAGAEKIGIAVLLRNQPSVDSYATHAKEPAFFCWKNGEFGQLQPCPQLGYRFQVENHLNDPVSRSLGAQLRQTLDHTASVFSQVSYIDSLLGALIHHLRGLQDWFLTHTPDPEHKMTPRQVSNVKQYIREHLDQSIPIITLAELVGLSEGYFYHAFKHTTGLTPGRYLTLTRIEKAKELLLKTAQPVIQVGMAVGYDNPSHFSRIFKKEVGVSPSKFCQQYTKT